MNLPDADEESKLNLRVEGMVTWATNVWDGQTPISRWTPAKKLVREEDTREFIRTRFGG